MNGTRKDNGSCAKSVPHLFELVDKDGNVVASFTPPCLGQMAEFAKHRWPDQEQDEDRTGKGWSILEVANG